MSRYLRSKALFEMIILIVATISFAMFVGAAGENQPTTIKTGEEAKCSQGQKCQFKCSGKGCKVNGMTVVGDFEIDSSGNIRPLTPNSQLTIGSNNYNLGQGATCKPSGGAAGSGAVTCSGGTMLINGASILGVSSVTVSSSGLIEGRATPNGGKVSYFKLGSNACFKAETTSGGTGSPRQITLTCPGTMTLESCSSQCQTALNGMQLTTAAGGASVRLPGGVTLTSGSVKFDGKTPVFQADSNFRIIGKNNLPIDFKVKRPTPLYMDNLDHTKDIRTDQYVQLSREGGLYNLMVSGSGIDAYVGSNSKGSAIDLVSANPVGDIKVFKTSGGKNTLIYDCSAHTCKQKGPAGSFSLLYACDDPTKQASTGKLDYVCGYDSKGGFISANTPQECSANNQITSGAVMDKITGSFVLTLGKLILGICVIALSGFFIYEGYNTYDIHKKNGQRSTALGNTYGDWLNIPKQQQGERGEPVGTVYADPKQLGLDPAMSQNFPPYVVYHVQYDRKEDPDCLDGEESYNQCSRVSDDYYEIRAADMNSRLTPDEWASMQTAGPDKEPWHAEGIASARSRPGFTNNCLNHVPEEQTSECK